jgi:GT2 family glycosyltransferase
MERKVNPVITVVIPCYNEVRYIQDCIISLLNNGFPSEKLEVLVVDGGSTDGTLMLLSELSQIHPQVKVLHNPSRFTPTSLNLGVMAARGEFTLISSAHASFAHGYMQTLLKTMEEQSDAIAVGGVMRTQVKNSHAISESIKTVLMHPLGVGNAKFRTGVNALMAVDTVPFGLFRSSLLKASGGYDERLIRNHDMELSKRLTRGGGKIYLTPHAICTYFARETFIAMAKNNYNNGKWNLKTVWITRTFSSLSLRHFIPLLFLMAWVLPLLISLVFCTALGAWFSLTLLGFYVGVLSLTAWQARTEDNKVLFTLMAFIVLHFAYGLGSLVGFFSLPFTPRNS